MPRRDWRLCILNALLSRVVRCAFCDYSEPCHWSLRKHFRLRHPGIALKVNEYRDPEKDARVEEVLNECMIHLNASRGGTAMEVDTSTWRPAGAMAQRGMRKRAGTIDQPLSHDPPGFDPPRSPLPPTLTSAGQESVPPR